MAWLTYEFVNIFIALAGLGLSTLPFLKKPVVLRKVSIDGSFKKKRYV